VQSVTESKRVCVVGPGTRFLSGITYYTYSLIEALARSGHPTSAVLIRNLVPTRLYPGRFRVGKPLTDLRLPENINRVDGVDWYWGWSIVRALRLLRKERPQVLILQWWTSAVLHTYLILAIAARLLRAEVIVEFHEAQDVSEEKMPLVGRYMDVLGRALLKLSSGQVIHSQFDCELIKKRYGLNGRISLVPHAGYDYLPTQAPLRSAPPETINILYFGVIRSFKGVEDLVTAFDLLDRDHQRFWLTVVGETWQDWDLPRRRITASPHRDSITFVNRYVTDSEVAGYFAGADLVVLPYHRSSSSGPLQIAMARGLPVVVTKVGGLLEATALYPGAVRVEPANPASLGGGIQEAATLVGERFQGVNSWVDTAEIYSQVFEGICG
jgi:glycosyltransferase involved in cell wall biosynthesis